MLFHNFKKTALIVMLMGILMGITSLHAQNKTISGTVSDTQGEVVIGASVMAAGNSLLGTVTDIDGKFTVSVPVGTRMNVSFIGYSTQEFIVDDKTTYNIVLAEDAEFLEETVVIGYGVQRKSDLTGSVASVREQEFQNRSTTDAAAALQGKAAGIQIINSSGAPGESAKIRVRGYSSNSGNIGPLLIVDGLKVDNISYLDPSMIASMEVLKDAASAAIY
jgi:outer membrane receptor protein involved in Fe transport